MPIGSVWLGAESCMLTVITMLACWPRQSLKRHANQRVWPPRAYTWANTSLRPCARCHSQHTRSDANCFHRRAPACARLRPARLRSGAGRPTDQNFRVKTMTSRLVSALVVHEDRRWVVWHLTSVFGSSSLLLCYLQNAARGRRNIW
jgi:hypothetical protein